MTPYEEQPRTSRTEKSSSMNRIITGHVLEGLRQLEDGSVNCCITSPPYFGLRDYGMPEQLGLENTPEEYVANMVAVFREVRRVLRDDGTLWLNIGDSYAGGGGGNFNNTGKTRTGCHVQNIRNKPAWLTSAGVKAKDLIGIPWMLAFALRADGWFLRQDIIWHKPNPMPESVTDRCTKSHEYLFLLTKSPKYYYDAEAIKSEAKNPADDYRRMNQQRDVNKSAPDELKNGIRVRKSGNKERKPASARGVPGDDTGKTTGDVAGSVPWEGTKANKRSVWTVTTKPFRDAHFATYPPELIEPCVLAGCPWGGIVLDPFFGSGTTGVVAGLHGRQYIGIELNPDYVTIAERRLQQELGLFK